VSTFKAYHTKHICSDFVEEYTPDGSATWVSGDLVFYDTGTNTMKKCGANPALIAAVAENPSTYGSLLNPNSKVPLRLLKTSDVIAMSSDTDYADSYVGDEVDISDAGSGVWKVLPASTGNPRVKILGGIAAADSLDGAIFFVQPLAANVQFDAIAS